MRTADCLVYHLRSEAWRRLPYTCCEALLSEWWLSACVCIRKDVRKSSYVDEYARKKRCLRIKGLKCMWGIFSLALKAASVCVCVCWETVYFILFISFGVFLICVGVCVQAFTVVWVSSRNLSSQSGGREGDRKPSKKDKNNNSAIFVVYGSEIEFVHQPCSPAMSQWVMSFQLCRCFNLQTCGELKLTPLTGWLQNGWNEAIKLSRPITEPLNLTRTAIFSPTKSFGDVLAHCDSPLPEAIIKL